MYTRMPACFRGPSLRAILAAAVVLGAATKSGAQQSQYPIEQQDSLWPSDELPVHPQFAPASQNPECGCYDGGGGLPHKYMIGVDDCKRRGHYGEPRWTDQHLIPWEAFAYGEYVGPYRTPHQPEYRVRVNDNIEFVYQLTREESSQPYRLSVGDEIEVFSAVDPDLSQQSIQILSDGTIQLRLIGNVIAAKKTIQQLQEELNERYQQAGVRNPSITVRGTKTDTPLQDLVNAVDARFGIGGQIRDTVVSPDGTVQLPMLGSIPAVGLTLDELEREANMRYRALIQGIEVTPILLERAPTSIYVLGEVNQGGRFQLEDPTTVMQAIALAQGWRQGANLRQVIVFRRDENWRLMATRLDLSGALAGNRPHPADEIWLRDSDIVLVPKMPIQRLSEIIDLYITRTAYAIMPNQGIQFNFDDAGVVVR